MEQKDQREKVDLNDIKKKTVQMLVLVRMYEA